ncbi:hypothetical protein [Chryseobacterium taichungense]|uniref:hypothetical protein n=1 Tax=Chryseobacterium taichungense TaxID=295069 RepID=UPI0015A65CE9|nr:hypothetical protein [Chryseobacterium taichungense]
MEKAHALKLPNTTHTLCHSVGISASLINIILERFGLRSLRDDKGAWYPPFNGG